LSFIENSWCSRGFVAVLLLPVSWIYRGLLRARRLAYAQGWKASIPVPLPVVVVGNLSIGGTGKTPLCAYLVERFAEDGWRPAIVSRGYGGKRHELPHLVCESDAPSDVGDEPVLLFEQTGVPVCVCANRAMAVQKIAESTNANIVFSDDGLQHLSMPRVAEVLVIDGQRGFGNGWVLPAGPLRDSFNSVQHIDLVAIQVPTTAELDLDESESGRELHRSLSSVSLRRLQLGAAMQCFSLQAIEAVELTTGVTIALSEFSGQRIHAVAGIGHPQRFFNSLEQLGLDVIAHSKADHAEYALADVDFEDDLPVLVTVKDAVKLKNIEGLPLKIYQITTRVIVSDTLDFAITKLKDKLAKAAKQ
jgi:tetraacyldisaccharide 4'-kinase